MHRIISPIRKEVFCRLKTDENFYFFFRLFFMT
jgi:hypothetical protein